MDRAAAEVARLFNAEADPGNVGGEIYPGYPGYVVAQGRLRQMTWELPAETERHETRHEAEAGQQHSSRQARQLHVALQLRRAALPGPVIEFVEAEGEKGS